MEATKTELVHLEQCIITKHGFNIIEGDKVLPLHQDPRGPVDRTVSNECSLRSVYICSLSFHFGHNLMNESGRLWACLDPAVMDSVEALVIVVQFPGSIYTVVPCDQWTNLQGQHPIVTWMMTLLRAFPLASKKSIVVTNGQTKFDNLIYPSRVLHAGWHPDRVNFAAIRPCFAMIRDFYCPHFSSQFRVYISRRQFDNQTRRQLQANPKAQHINHRICNNEEAFELALCDRGFQIYTFENLSSEEQITLASRATVLMSLGGSGLHHSCFCQSAAHLISLGDFRWVNATSEPNGNQTLANMMVPGLKCSFIKMRTTEKQGIYYTLDLEYTLAEIDKIL